MAAVAPAPGRTRPQRAAPKTRPPAPARRAPARSAARPRIAGGVLWIVLVAVLLAGIVAVNVAALRLNLESQRLEEQRDKLAASNADRKSELSSLAAAARVEAVGKASGLTLAAEPAYVRARRGGR